MAARVTGLAALRRQSKLRIHDTPITADRLQSLELLAILHDDGLSYMAAEIPDVPIGSFEAISALHERLRRVA